MLVANDNHTPAASKQVDEPTDGAGPPPPAAAENVPTTTLPQTQVSTPGRRLRPPQKQRTPLLGRPAHRPPTSRRRRPVRAEQLRIPARLAWKLEDGGRSKRQTATPYRAMGNEEDVLD